MKNALTPSQRVLAGVVLVLLGVGLSSLVAIAQGGDTAPQDPPWMDSDAGTIDISRMPDEIPVAGPDGEPCIVDGERYTISRDELFAPPPSPEELTAFEDPPGVTRTFVAEVVDGEVVHSEIIHGVEIDELVCPVE